MKKIIRNASIALFAAVASFGIVACGGDDPEPEPQPQPPSTTKKYVDSDYGTIHDMILPAGTGANIPKWTVAGNGVQDLPEFVTGFLDKNEKGKYVVYNGKTNRTDELKAAVKKANDENFFDDKTVKNVIVVFSDGWGESHRVAAAKYYGDLIADLLPYHAPINHDSFKRRSSKSEGVEPQWTYDAATNDWNISETKPDGSANTVEGKAITINTDNTTFETTDSTAGGTAINTGFTTYYSACDTDLNGTEVKNISELAREKGMLVGNVTNDWLSDATPATVSVHSPKRKDSNILYARLFLTTPDFCMGNDGGYKSYVNGEMSLASISGNGLVHLKPWYDANITTLRTWAGDLLAEYDNVTGKDMSAYDFTTWGADRKVFAKDDFVALMDGLGADVSKRPLGSFDLEHDFDMNDTYPNFTSKNSRAPCLAYKLGYGDTELLTSFPNFPEMVASTLSYLDRKAKAENRGFFAFIENTCSDGWGHASAPYDCLNETICVDEGIAIAIKYVLENPDTLLVITADHETGGLQYKKGWSNVERDAEGNLVSTGYKKISSSTGGHSSQPIPVFAFGAGAKANWGDCVFPDTSSWTEADWIAYVQGDCYPSAPSATGTWNAAGVADATDPKFPKILRNRTTGIRIGKAMGFDKFGDLNGNGILDPDTESDSIVTYTVGSAN